MTLKEVDLEIKKPTTTGCKVCSKNGKIEEKRYTKIFYKSHDGKMPRIVFDNGNDYYDFYIRFCPQCGRKLC